MLYPRTSPTSPSDEVDTKTYYIFDPSSSNATLYGVEYSGEPLDRGPVSFLMTDGASLSRFASSLPGHQLPPGEYTLLVEDFWGQIVKLSFTIS